MVLPPERATAAAVGVSGVTAVLLGLYGFFTLQLWLVVIAFFIYNAGRMEAQASTLNRAFEGKTVADLMTRDPITVTPDMRLTQFLQLIHFRPHTGYPVVDADGRLLGFARLSAAKRRTKDGNADEGPAPARGEAEGGLGAAPLTSLTEAEPAEIDPNAKVADIIEPAETVAPGTPALDALRSVAQGRLGRLVVVDQAGRVVGLLSKTDLVRELRDLYETGRTSGR